MADEPTFERRAEPVRRRSGFALVLGTALLAFVLGAAIVAWLAWRGQLPGIGHRHDRAASAQAPFAAPATNLTATPVPTVAPPAIAAAPALSARIDSLEQRLDRLDLRAEAAAGNTARAEGLLIAFAARRMIDRGAPLGYLEDQLKLRFADAQPNAVETLIDAARNPVTLEQLSARLEALAPALGAPPRSGSAWQRLRQGLSDLFVIRHEASPTPAPQTRLDHAREALVAGNVAAAIAEVQHLPGAAAAAVWIADARRYQGAHQALDLIETTALLDTGRLQNGAGRKVQQPSPAAPPPDETGGTSAL
ncbi:MAG: hypothetical protein JF593_12560 [Novosphingobium sp.]|nr:hypothetical protein [Novosphingobium sp.]